MLSYGRQHPDESFKQNITYRRDILLWKPNRERIANYKGRSMSTAQFAHNIHIPRTLHQHV